MRQARHSRPQQFCSYALGIVWTLTALSACADSSRPTPAAGAAEAALPPAKRIEQLAIQAEASGESVVPGKESWLFFAPELRHLSAGRFWGEAAPEVSRAPDPAAVDPLPAILDFKAQLEAVGVELFFIPVPAKAAIYPQFLPGAEPWPAATLSERLDIFDREFLSILADEGVAVLDLVPDFLEHSTDGEPLYCRQDTHWSPRACKLAAQHIVTALGDRSWIPAARETAAVEGKIAVEEQRITIRGDLWLQLPEPRPPKEELILQRIGLAGSAGIEPLTPWRESPVLLLGDSHTLVFHAGDDLHARGGGLADHLAFELGFPVDLVGVRGSGATPARVNLLRRRDSLAGKKVVIWCLSVREYTEGQGWKQVPVVKK